MRHTLSRSRVGCQRQAVELLTQSRVVASVFTIIRLQVLSIIINLVL